MRRLRVLLTGGGSGGHTYPLLAVFQELKKLSVQNNFNIEIRYFGEKDNLKVFEEKGIKMEKISSSKLRRYFSVLNFLDAMKFFVGFFQSLWKVFWFMPDVVFSKGGPGALVVLFASKFYMIPIIIHESDSVAGLTSVVSGKLARKIFVAFDSVINCFSSKKVVVVGNPVRDELISRAPTNKAFLGFDPNVPLLLILGGSLGATRINNFVLENLPGLLTNFQVIHQVGILNYNNYDKEYRFLSRDWPETQKKRYQYRPYFDRDLADVYSAADLVLSRAGAGTIFELAYFGKPAVLIPLPEAAGNHQIKNAFQYASGGAAIVIQPENFLSHLVIKKLIDLINNREALRIMSESARNFYKPNAAFLIAEYLLKTILK